MRRIVHLGHLLAASGLLAGSVHATVLTWNGSTTTLWNNPTNWLPQQVPTAADTVVLNTGTLTATTNTAFAVMNWNGGSLYGALTVASGSALNLGGTALYLYGTLTNAGTVVSTNTGFLRLYYSPPTYYGAIYNQPGGLFDVRNDQFYLDTAYGAEFFSNGGTLRKSAGTGTTRIYPRLLNGGTVDAETGIIAFNGGGVLGGQYTAVAGATISMASGSYTNSGPAQFSGAGAFQFNGGTLTLLGDLVPGLRLLGGTLFVGSTFQGGSITNLPLAGMTLQSTNVLTGIMNWTAGSITGGFTVSNGATLYLGGSSLYLYGALTNAGTIVSTNTGFLRLYYSPPTYYGAIYNQPGGLFDIRNDQFYLDTAYGAEFFSNGGTLRKSAGAGTTRIYPRLLNGGTVDAESGTLAFYGGGILSGQYTAAAGATVSLANGSYTNSGPAQFTGAGAFQFNGGTLTLLNNLVSGLQLLGGTLFLGPAFQGGSITNLPLAGMTLQSTNTVTGTMNWTAGSVAGGLTVASSGTLYLGGSSLYLYAGLTNAGTIVATNTSFLRLYYSPPTYYGAIYNQPGGLFDVRNDLFYLDTTYGSEFFSNGGTLRKSAGTGTTRIYPRLLNGGTVDAETGTIAFNGGGVLGGQYTAAGGATISMASGSYTNSGPAQFSGAGAFQFNGGTLTLLGDLVPGLRLLGGTLFLGPTFQGGSVTNLPLAGMTLQSTNVLTGIMNWTAGSITGGFTVSNGATLYLGGSSLYLYGALTNAGTIVSTNTGFLRLYYSPPNYYGAIYNQPSGLFDVRNDQFYLDTAYGAEFFSNGGTLRKSAGAGTTRIYPRLFNGGSVDAETGTISFNGGGLLNGQYHSAAGAAIVCASGVFTNDGAAQFTGPGLFQFNGGTLNLPNNLVPGLQLLGGTLYLGPAFQGGSITNLPLAGMTLQSTNTLTGTMNWTGGSVAGGLTVASSGTLYLGGSALYLYAGLTNAGAIVSTNTGFLRLYYSPPNYYGAIYNQPGGLFDVRNDQFYLDTAYGAEFFNNAGTLRKSAGTGTSRIYPLINNAGGLIEADSGTIGLQTVPNLAGGEMRFGLSSLNSFGMVNIPGNAVLNGTVGVSLLGGYTPPTNTSFTVLTYGSHTSIFPGLDLPPGVIWATNYTSTAFTFLVVNFNDLVFTPQPPGGQVANATLPPVVVQVSSPTGSPLAINGVPVTLALVSGTGALLGTVTQNTDASGKATYSNLRLNLNGYKVLQATAPSLTPAVTAPFRIFAPQEGQWTANGFLLSLYGTNSLGSTIIYATTNLKSSWTPIYTNPPTPNVIQFLDTKATNFNSRFYRTVEQ